MAITHVKIHPATGIARLGNSPADFFTGPEKRWEYPNPPGGFKDDQCRVKRQAARFRIFAYHDNGLVKEVTAADAQITWKVHLANKKAVARNNGETAADMTIDDGQRILNGPNQRQECNAGKIKFSGAAAVNVLLGEIRTDNDSHLLVLGGAGKSGSPNGETIQTFADNPGWYDDIADGPVEATVKMNGSGTVFTAAGAWVIVAPPKFAPHIDNVITLYDAVYNMAANKGWVTPPASPSYTNDIFPILQRARDTKWVVSFGMVHGWADPVYNNPTRTNIFNKLTSPTGGGGNMPRLAGGARLTKVQYELMEKWKNNSFQQDWAGIPVAGGAIDPQGLDRAALEHCVGAAFYPGIEAGGIGTQAIITDTHYVGAGDPMRLKHSTLSPGDISAKMAVPWQADFNDCGSNWWPVPRPNTVLPQGTTTPQAWDRGIGNYEGMINKWHTLGFVVKQGNIQVEVERCDTSSIQLITPTLNFLNVPQGSMGTSRKTALAVNFEVRSTGGPVTLEVTPANRPAHPRLQLDAYSVTVGPTAGSAIALASFWVIYETGAIGETIPDTLTVTQAGGTGQWQVSIAANTVARKTAAVALVLDRSGSMLENRGDGQTKHQSLKEAASILVDVMVEGDAMGIACFNQDAQKLQDILPLGNAADPFDAARTAVKNIINGPGLNPSGETSIGDGIFEGRQLLNAAPASFDVKSLIVLTDGKENRARFISEVSPQINELTYSIGLGKPENISVPALQTISGNNGGYLLITGPVTGNNRFVLQKYFLQILAGINNTSVVLDPAGELKAGQQLSIPFLLTEADECVEVILLTPEPRLMDFKVQTPNGFIIDPSKAGTSILFVSSDGVAYYRIALPAEIVSMRFDRAGTWNILLSTKYKGKPEANGGEVHVTHGFNRQPSLPYSVVVNSSSNLSSKGSLQQSSYLPGAALTLSMSLAQNGMPALCGGHAFAEITRPDRSTDRVILNETEPGLFSGSYTTTQSGVYHCRLRGTGHTRAGYPFHREETLNAAVWAGANIPDTNTGGHDAPAAVPACIYQFRKKYAAYWWILFFLLFLILICFAGLLLR